MVMEILFIDIKIRNGEKKKVKLAEFYLFINFLFKNTNNSVNIFHLNLY